jgi:hypothetical protein
MAISADSRWLATTWDPPPDEPDATDKSRRLLIWDLKTGALSKAIELGDDMIVTAAFAPGTTKLYTVGGKELPGPGELRVWEVEGDKPPRVLRKLGSAAASMALGPRNKVLVKGDAEDSLIVLEAVTGKEQATIATGKLGWRFEISHDGKHVAVELPKYRMAIYDIASGSKIADFDAPKLFVAMFRWSPDDKVLAVTNGCSVTLDDPVTPISTPAFWSGACKDCWNLECCHFARLFPVARWNGEAGVGIGTISIRQSPAIVFPIRPDAIHLELRDRRYHFQRLIVERVNRHGRQVFRDQLLEFIRPRAVLSAVSLGSDCHVDRVAPGCAASKARYGNAIRRRRKKSHHILELAQYPLPKLEHFRVDLSTLLKCRE